LPIAPSCSSSAADAMHSRPGLPLVEVINRSGSSFPPLHRAVLCSPTMQACDAYKSDYKEVEDSTTTAIVEDRSGIGPSSAAADGAGAAGGDAHKSGERSQELLEVLNGLRCGLLFGRRRFMESDSRGSWPRPAPHCKRALTLRHLLTQCALL